MQVADVRRKALFLATYVYMDGGIQRFNRTFLSACERLGVSCDVLSLGDDEQSRSRWEAPKSATIRVFNASKARFAIAACGAVLCGGYDFIIVGHIHLLELVASNLTFRKIRRRRVLLIAHGVDVWSGLESWRLKHALKAVDIVLSVSRYTRDRMRAQRPELAEERFAIFPNALSEVWQQRFARTELIEPSLDLPYPFLLSVTRLDRGDRYKGLTSVIETLAMLEDTSVHYIIAGQGEDRAFLERMAGRFALTDRVHFVGALSDLQLARLYAQCSAFVLPSGKEGFGIVFLEAMYHGAPVIAARERGTIDVVCDGETGLTVPYGDTIALSYAITRVLRDDSLRARLRKNGRELVSVTGPFSFESYVRRLGNVLGVSLPDAGDDAVRRSGATGSVLAEDCSTQVS
jgi:glycosyltransferase involved in cell wall biosynthesis